MKILARLPVALRPSRPVLLTFALVLPWLLVMRLALGVHAMTWLVSPAALASDLAGAVMLTTLLVVVRRGVPRAVLVFLVAAGFYAAGEHLIAHGTLFRMPHIIDALDPTFVGSAGAFGWNVIALPIYLGLTWALHALQRRVVAGRPRRVRDDLRLALATALGVLVYALVVPNLTAPVNNVVATGLAQSPLILTTAWGPTGAEGVEPVDEALDARFFEQRLGAPAFAERPNILVIMIEGLSAAYLPGIADYHGLERPAVQLPELERGLDERGFRTYRNVLGMQRQTDRGSYPMLCGEYPRLASEESKMTAIAEGKRGPVCLPEILARHGYFTTYQQAAELSYMSKDRFMPRAGFTEALGASDLAPEHEIEGWGLEDELFFTRAGNRLNALTERRSRPWFATLLNVGTHHPFAQAGETAAESPDEFGDELTAIADSLDDEVHEERQAAFTRMADELLVFLDRMAGDGILDDTLVVVTSDEAGGFIRGEGEPHPLSGNFGFMAVRPPVGVNADRLRGRDEIVAHIDLAVTGVDAAGLGQSDPGVAGMTGHSLFALNNDDRGLLLGNTYDGQSLFLLTSGRLMQCAETLLRCTDWVFEPERLVGSLEPDDGAEFLDLPTRRRLADHAALIGPDRPEQ